MHRRSLSDSKLAALCSEVWPVLALIGGVDSGLRAGGLCLHRPSGRRAILLGVLKEGSSMAKLQWEEADLSVRYKSIYGRMSQLVSLKWQLSLTSINQFLYFPCLDPFSMFITVYNSFPVLFLLLLTFYFHFIISSSDLALFFFALPPSFVNPLLPYWHLPAVTTLLCLCRLLWVPFTTIPITKLHEFLVTQRHTCHLAGAV